MPERRGLILDFKAALSRRERDQETFMADGKATSFEDYRFHAGIIAGLRQAQDEFGKIVRLYVDEKED